MKAVALTRYLPLDDPESLFDTELPKPQARGRDLLVAVKAVAVNPLDNRVRRPKDKVEPAPKVLGWDAAGVVEAVGEEVTQFRPGDTVYYAGDINRPGSNSEYQLVDERLVGASPASLSFEEAAALPLSSLTAWEALFDRLRISRTGKDRGKSILVIGAAGGVGSMAVQLAVRVAGLEVIGSASRPESREWLRRLGARHVINHYEDMPAQLRQLGIAQVDYVLILADTNRHYPAAAEVIAPQGAICTAVEAKEPIDWGLLWDKSVTLVWVMVFTRTDYQSPDMAQHGEALREISRLVDAGVLKTTLTQTIAPINAENLRHALAQVASGKTIGKIALRDF